MKYVSLQEFLFLLINRPSFCSIVDIVWHYYEEFQVLDTILGIYERRREKRHDLTMVCGRLQQNKWKIKVLSQAWVTSLVVGLMWHIACAFLLVKRCAISKLSKASSKRREKERHFLLFGLTSAMVFFIVLSNFLLNNHWALFLKLCFIVRLDVFLLTFSQIQLLVTTGPTSVLWLFFNWI